MRPIVALFMGRLAPGVWRVDELAGRDTQLARELGLAPVVIDLTGVETKAQLMDVLATGLDLPDYFGKNFDALYDCLTDQPPHRLIAFVNPTALLAAEPRTCELLCEVGQDAADSWLGRGVTTNMLWVSSAPAELPSL